MLEFKIDRQNHGAFTLTHVYCTELFHSMSRRRQEGSGLHIIYYNEDIAAVRPALENNVWSPRLNPVLMWQATSAIRHYVTNLMTFRGRRDLHIIPPTMHMAVSITVQSATITRQQSCLNSSLWFILCASTSAFYTATSSSMVAMIIQLNDTSKLATATGRWATFH